MLHFMHQAAVYYVVFPVTYTRAGIHLLQDTAYP